MNFFYSTRFDSGREGFVVTGGPATTDEPERRAGGCPGPRPDAAHAAFKAASSTVSSSAAVERGRARRPRAGLAPGRPPTYLPSSCPVPSSKRERATVSWPGHRGDELMMGASIGHRIPRARRMRIHMQGPLVILTSGGLDAVKSLHWALAHLSAPLSMLAPAVVLPAPTAVRHCPLR